MPEIEECIREAIGTIRNFVKETTGEEATPEEIAKALTRYFVLKEIGDHIMVERGGRDSGE